MRVAVCCHAFTEQQERASYLESDVIKLAAVADGGSAGMDHAVHLNNARAALRSFPGPFPGGAARRRAAGRGFAFGSLLARHVLGISKKKTILTKTKSRPKSAQGAEL